ncbi:hypothetical protein [Phycicoccus jejuensis]|uniref:hypothetical protein n=1 Tax=Phycicoccus jejuensis TaxID=367299 RepID=UPI0004C3DB10|nr:hypothetical protein [Phycicoccus jejuensis]
MSVTVMEGVTAGSHSPIWIIPAALVDQDPTDGTYSIPLSVLTDPTVVQIDGYLDAGDVSVSRSPQTRTRQRLSQAVAQNVVIGETVDVTVSAVYDQQAADGAAINKAYDAMPKGAEVYVAQAFGWFSGDTPTTATKIDLAKGAVQSRYKNQPTSGDEDLKFSSVVSVEQEWADVALTAA